MEHLPADLVKSIKDEKRLETLSRSIIRSGQEDDDFVAIVEAAARRFSAPSAIILIADCDENWVQAVSGMDVAEVPTRSGLFVYPLALEKEPVMVVNNPARDAALAPSVPKVEGGKIRFFAGAPIHVHGVRAGTLCVVDTEKHKGVSREDGEALARLAGLAGSLYELKHAARGKRLADRALERAQRRHSLALRAANIAAWSWDGTSETIECDDALRSLLDLPPGQPVTRKSFVGAIAPELRFAAIRQFRSALERGEEYQFEFKVQSTGRWLLSLGGTYDGAATHHQGGTVFGAVVDITSTKEAEQKTRLLLRELNHRVKNTLAIVQSMAGQTLRRSRSAAEFNMAFSGRLQALSAAHTLLSDEQWGAISLERLLRSQIMPYAENIERQIDIHGDQVYLDPDEALALGMVMHELASNAAKYGALSVSTGIVDITIGCSEGPEGPTLKLDWIEVGGPKVLPPDHKGFGAILIERSLDKIIGSKVDVDYAENGLQVQIRMPLRFC